MATKKQEKEQELPKPEVEQNQSMPLGMIAKDNVIPTITFKQIFDLLRIAEALSNFVNYVKQENFNNDNIRYYFESDLELVFDKDGNPVMVDDGKGGKIQQKKLSDSFWQKQPENTKN